MRCVTRRLSRRATEVAALIALACASPAQVQHRPEAPQNQPVNPQAQALTVFTQRVEEYVKLRKDAASKVPPAQETKDAAKIVARQKALAAGIRAARANAKPGDIFVPEVVPQFRKIVRASFEKRPEVDERAVMKEVPKDAPVINSEYPDEKPMATMPPKVLLSLQKLPEGLEYRFMRRHLVLLDIEANLIADYIVNVLTADAVPGGVVKD